jgi:hypothetical protein
MLIMAIMINDKRLTETHRYTDTRYTVLQVLILYCLNTSVLRTGVPLCFTSLIQYDIII